MKAEVNATFFTFVNKTFEVSCPFECIYCDNGADCAKCKGAYYFECEEEEDSDRNLRIFFSWVCVVLIILLALTGLYDFKLNIDVWMIINAIQIARCVTIMNPKIEPVFRNFLNRGFGLFTFMFSIDYMPYDVLLSSKTISWEFSQFRMPSELFLVTLIDGIVFLTIVVGFFIVLLAIFECCRPTGKSKRC